MGERVIYLASESPRRRELVLSLGVPVVAGMAPFDEDEATAAYAGDVEHLAEHLARAKAEATVRAHYAELPSGAAVVAADTTVLLDGESLGKPRDAAEARDMLTRLRNRQHQVVTAVAVIYTGRLTESAVTAGALATRAVQSTRVTTLVTMRDYTDSEIATYVASGDPADKAGAYAIQHAEFRPVEAIAGCYLAVVGLPLCALTFLLAAAEDTTDGDLRRFHAQEAERRRQRCPWSSACRQPLPRWQPLRGGAGIVAHQAK